MAEIKKTMVDALAFVTEHGNMSAENLETFTKEFCVAKSRTSGESKPREAVKLYDAEGNVIGRKCSVLHTWLKPEDFNGDIEKMSISREANKVKTTNQRAADAIVREAEAVRLEANELEDPMEKLAKYEEYDAKIEEARAKKAEPIVIEGLGFDTVEELAEDLGVEVITTKASADL